ncbi:MAG: 30S ribosomal protein S18 [Planctomycetota bacterium]|nr:MAG: 30S ribosomal protein S18 [Planctomycetota bacterium]
MPDHNLTAEVAAAESSAVPKPAKYPEHLDYKDMETLARFMNSQGNIQGRKRTNFNTQRQKALKLAIKRARHMAFLPFVG